MQACRAANKWFVGQSFRFREAKTFAEVRTFQGFITASVVFESIACISLRIGFVKGLK